MSKKKKKTFKAKLAQALSNVDAGTDSTPKTIYEKPKIEKEIKRKKRSSDTQHIKKDIRQIVIATCLCIVMLLVIIYFNKTTSYVENFSKNLANYLNIQI